jgi:hypothetical protein
MHIFHFNFFNFQLISNAVLNIYDRCLFNNTCFSEFDKTLLKPRRCSDEVIDFIKDARSKWEDGINEELYAIISESKRPFVLLRSKYIYIYIFNNYYKY